MDPKKNFKGQPVFSAEVGVQNDEQSAGQHRNGQKKGKGRSPSALQGCMPEAPVQQAEYCAAPFNNGGNRGRGNACWKSPFLLENVQHKIHMEQMQPR